MAKAKRGFMDGYKHYDPAVEGFGSVDDWIRTAEAAFDDPNFIAGLEVGSAEFWKPADTSPEGLERASARFHGKPVRAPRIDPDLQVLGLDAMPPNETTLKSAMRRALIPTHPDHGGSREAMEVVTKAWERLVWKMRRAAA